MAQRKQKKQKQKKQTAKAPQPSIAVEKVPRLAHKILTQMIWPANLNLEEAIDVVIMVAKGIVLSNTSNEDLEDRSGMIDWIEDRFTAALDEIDPLVEPAHAWLVEPQGLITEPVGILWFGLHAEDSVHVAIGEELALLRAEIAESPASVIVTEGVEGVAITDPEWDGEETVACGNPQCGQVHDVHLMVAENLFAQAKQRGEQRAVSN